MTIAQIVYDNELSFGYTDEDIHEKVMQFVLQSICVADLHADLQNLGSHG